MTANPHLPAPAVVISGASTGIGKACAVALTRRGLRVFAGVRTHEAGQELQRESSGRIKYVLLDVADSGSIAAAAENVRSELGDRPLRGIVNNAGIGLGGPLEFIPLESLRQQFEVNVIGQIAVTQAFMPLIRRDRGRIVMMGSGLSSITSPFAAPYAASKSALRSLTSSLRVELAPWRIQVSTVIPGRITTPIWGKSIRELDDVLESLPSEGRELYGEAIAAMKRTFERADRKGIPAEAVADAVVHALLSKRPKTRYLVGRDALLAELVGRSVFNDRIADWFTVRQLGLPRREMPSTPADERPAAGRTRGEVSRGQ